MPWHPLLERLLSIEARLADLADKVRILWDAHTNPQDIDD